MISPAEAHAAIVAHAPRLSSESIRISAAIGRVLQQTIVAERDQPPFDRVAMDGIAIASNAWLAGKRAFAIEGTQAAGAPPLQLTSASGCIEVMTGAMLPIGCDCVIPVERIAVRDGNAQVEASLQIGPGMHIHKRGADCVAAQSLLDIGTLLGVPEIAVIASAGLANVKVTRAPRIAVISTGDELIEPGEPITAWQIRRSNVYAVEASLRRHGFCEIENDHLRDDEQTLRSRLTQHLQTHDVLILSGGVSMGKFDFVPKILAELGVREIFHKIAQRPGKPMWFGVRDDGKAVYALPGNPVSTLACMARYVLPGLAHASGKATTECEAKLNSSVALQTSLHTLLPVKLRRAQNLNTAEPRPTQGSGDFISLIDSDGLVELPPGTMTPGGAIVKFYAW